MKTLFIGALLLNSLAIAQPVAFPTTTLVGTLTGWPAAHQPATVIHLASTAAVIAGINPISTSGIGDPVGHTNVILMVDTEAMCVNGPVMPGNLVPVERGCQGTYVRGHNNGATVYVGPPSYYTLTAPAGSCDEHALPVLPVVYLNTGGIYNCVAGSWVYEGLASQSLTSSAGPIWHKGQVHAAKKDHWYKRFERWLKSQFTLEALGPGGLSLP